MDLELFNSLVLILLPSRNFLHLSVMLISMELSLKLSLKDLIYAFGQSKFMSSKSLQLVLLAYLFLNDSLFPP